MLTQVTYYVHALTLGISVWLGQDTHNQLKQIYNEPALEHPLSDLFPQVIYMRNKTIDLQTYFVHWSIWFINIGPSLAL